MTEKSYISIIICTHNRCESLKDTLSSLVRQEHNDNFDFEIIVVDNNSRDKTKEVVYSFVSEFGGHLKYIFETSQGQSHARNRGIREARGGIIAFTDDDCIVDKNWLKWVYYSFAEEKCDLMGGRILPQWSNPPPSWLSKRLYGKLALLDYGDKVFEIKTKTHPIFGANFAFKKELFPKYGFFNTDIGAKGKKLFRGDDTDIFMRFVDRGARPIYQPHAVIHHKIEPERLKKSYFRRWYFFAGQSYAKLLPHDTNVILGLPYWMLREFLESILIYFYSLLSLNMKAAFEYQLKLISFFGTFYMRLKQKISYA